MFPEYFSLIFVYRIYIESITDAFSLFLFSHETETTHWLDPRLINVQKVQAEECTDDGE